MLSIKEIAKKISSGQVGIIPTDTVYGLVCSAHKPAAVERVYKLKHRENKPGTLVAASIDQLVSLGIPRRYLKAVEQYWPNAISIVIPIGSLLPELQQGKGSLAVRIPKDAKLQELLSASGPLLTTSANDPGQPTATTVAMAKDYFGDTVDFYLDGGDLSDREPSTIIRIIDDAVEILREGAVKISEDGSIK